MFNLMKLPLPAILALIAAIFLSILASQAIAYNDLFLGSIVLGLLLLVFALVGSGENAITTRIILGFVVLGYFISGKGFAYLGAQPFYIGEVCLAATGAILALRIALKRASIFPTGNLGKILLILIGTGLVQLLLTIGEYQMLAARDFMMIGYAGYFFIAYDAFANAENRRKMYKIWSVAGAIGLLTTVQFIFGFHWPELVPLYLKGRPLFLPHDDTRVPLAATAFIMLLIMSYKNLFFVFIRMIVACMIINISLYGKSAYALAILFCSSPYLITKFRNRFIILAVSLAVVSVPLGTILILVGGEAEERVERLFEEAASLNPKNIFTKSGQASGATTEWRVFWWKKIIEETWRVNFLLGQGLGSDITLEFQKQYFGQPVVEDDGSLPRYPHNVLFTILGRLGLVGVLVWGCFFFRVIADGLQFFKMASLHKADVCQFAVWSFVFAGIANGFVQSTYEAPFAAIPFWVILACAYREREELLKGKKKYQEGIQEKLPSADIFNGRIKN